ncbi:MAG: Do family serine endopeptidase [Candidatus Omnitrophica bacterium]|nr:Do family serine endopeptidase [Candidatus Omnitrophota bacterium]MDD5553164.1 Do family serine endopeptidase [Candidatus Omnitrophota bacterium]
MKRKILLVSVLLISWFCAAQCQETTVPSPAGLEEAIINLADTAGNAVVSISTEHTQKIGGRQRYRFRSPFGQQSPFGEDDPFRSFFEDFFGEIPEREYKQIGLGSGVIIDERGYILTNQHVISDADKISVTLADGRNFTGTVKGQDARSDIAIIQIKAPDLPAATLGDSSALKIGQWVVAVGNPFGFALDNPEPTVTVGVISALHRALGRTLGRERDYNDLIQTDAAINPGNSGGPLVNLKGEVVGINVAIFSTSGGYQGIGFAIPINKAKNIISKLIEGKKISYGWFGITVQDLTDELAKYFGLSDKKGALVANVLENSPAQKAGVKQGDVIRQLNDKPIESVRQLLDAVGQAEIGRKAKVRVLREKKEIVLNVEVGERPENAEEEGGELGAEPSEQWRGLEVGELTPDIARRLGMPPNNNKGAVIMGVEPGSEADDAGVVAGDVILEFDKQPVTNISDYKKAVKAAKGDALLRLHRGYVLIKEKK